MATKNEKLSASVQCAFSRLENHVMAIPYYRWIKTHSPDLTTALQRKQLRSTYQKNGEQVESESALWVFRLDQLYKPEVGISTDRTLVRIIFNDEGELIMEHPDNHLDFEDPEFKGETGHPIKIIVKQNERGARGIGARLLELVLNPRVQSIGLANAKEIKKATSC
jgi:hypothetical protein